MTAEKALAFLVQCIIVADPPQLPTDPCTCPQCIKCGCNVWYLHHMKVIEKKYTAYRDITVDAVFHTTFRGEIVISHATVYDKVGIVAQFDY